MRYVIVCVVKGEAGRFNNEMRRDIFKKFNAKSSKLPAHFTIKAPFEYEGSIKELEEELYKFSNEVEKAHLLWTNIITLMIELSIWMLICLKKEKNFMIS